MLFNSLDCLHEHVVCLVIFAVLNQHFGFEPGDLKLLYLEELFILLSMLMVILDEPLQRLHSLIVILLVDEVVIKLLFVSE